MCQVQHYPIEEEPNWVLAEEGEAEYPLVLMMLLESGLAQRSGDVLRETCPSYSLAVRPVSGAGLKLLSRESGEEDRSATGIIPPHPLSWPCVSELATT